MGMLERFSDIIASNVNAALDKLEDPSKMIDQHLRNLTNDLAEVKKETAGVMAEEKRSKRLLDENTAAIAKQTDLAKRALTAGNEDDARVFLGEKKKLEEVGASLAQGYQIAQSNAAKMRQMHDKLVSDINGLNARKDAVKAKVAVAKTQNRINKMTMPDSSRSKDAFDRYEKKADNMLDKATALADLNAQPMNEADEVAKKYAGSGVAVDDELAALKAEMGIN